MGRYASFFKSRENLRRFRILCHVPQGVRVGLVGFSRGGPLPDPILFSLVSIVEGGVTFPLSPLVRRFLGFLGVSPILVAPDAFKIITAVEAINSEIGLGLGLRELCHCYCFRRSENGIYSLEPRNPDRALVSIRSESCMDGDVVVVSGSWEFGRGPRDSSPFPRTSSPLPGLCCQGCSSVFVCLSRARSNGSVCSFQI